MRNGELSRFGVELYYGTVLADEFWPSFLCNCVVANKRGDSIHKTIPSVFQIRHGSLVNDLSKRASWPDRWHISVRLNIAKKLAHGLGDPSDGLHDQPPPLPPPHLKELTGMLPIMQFDTTLWPHLLLNFKMAVKPLQQSTLALQTPRHNGHCDDMIAKSQVKINCRRLTDINSW